MTHSAGFEWAVKDLEVGKPGDLIALGQYPKGHQPHQIFSPGTVPAYSNYGANLAGYIVQRLSGMPFEQYVQKNIFAPLGMTKISEVHCKASTNAHCPQLLGASMATGQLPPGESLTFEVDVIVTAG